MPLRNQFESEAEWLDHLRLYFAAKAMAGLWANQQWMVNAHNATGKGPAYCIAKAAYESADAMLAARETKS